MYKCLTLIIALIVVTASSFAQPQISETITFEEYLAFVKKYHPLFKQANLTLSFGEANLLKARGAFDPKIEVDYNRKKFKGTTYYDKLNTTFKIPTWYGIEFKGNYEDNSGVFLDPSFTVPEDGLYSAGISFSLAQGFLINERMASLKKAKYFLTQSKADRDLLVNNALYNASLAYFEWIEAWQEELIYTSFLENSNTRLKAITRSVEEGDKAEIDITEAKITVQNRTLELEAARLKRRKAKLKASTFLWLEDVPLTIEDAILPELPSLEILKENLILNGITNTNLLDENHPKLRSLKAKIGSLEVDRNLKINKLLPKVNLQYNFLSQDYDRLDNFNTSNYKTALNISVPIFLRKERGDLKLANLKLSDAQFENSAVSLSLKNKIEAINLEITSLETQNTLIEDIVSDYTVLVSAEERKFSLGESSLFLINSREQKLISAKLKENTLSVKQLKSLAELYNTLGLTDITEN
jgi:outer membrane protein TolC